jgi:hypothetical protein
LIFYFNDTISVENGILSYLDWFKVVLGCGTIQSNQVPLLQVRWCPPTGNGLKIKNDGVVNLSLRIYKKLELGCDT